VGDRVKAGDMLGLVEAMKMEIGFDAPVGGTVTEVRVRKGQQVAAGEVMLVIDPASDDEQGGTDDQQLELPPAPDPLALLFHEERAWLGEPDLSIAAAASPQQRAEAMLAVEEDIRRVILGYDAYKPRVAKLIAFLEAPIPEGLSQDFLEQLASVRSHLSIAVDVDRLFLRSTRHRLGSRELDPLSNNALLRLFVRRMRAGGAGLPQRFLDVLRQALSHYDDVSDLSPSASLERAVVRLFASQVDPAMRFRLLNAVLRRVMSLVAGGLALEDDKHLRETLESLAAMRGHVPNALADAAIEAVYGIYQRPLLEKAAERTTQQVETWLSRDKSALSSAPDLDDLALAPPGRFRRMLSWLHDDNVRRREVALSALVRRVYAPKRALSVAMDQGLELLTFASSQVVAAALLRPHELAAALEGFASVCRDRQVTALDLFVPLTEQDSAQECIKQLQSRLRPGFPAARVTLSFIDADLAMMHESFAISSGEVKQVELCGLHPETAERLEFNRYQSFELELLESHDDIYCFYGKSREVPDDERVFVLAEVRGRPREPGPHARSYLSLFERTFHEATGTLRHAIGLRDPGRRLQWNRLVLFVAHPLRLEAGLDDWLAQKLYPATRHLGLERVGVRLKVLRDGSETVDEVEVTIADPTGSRMEVKWREPHTAPLVPVATYQRSVVAARRRGLIYPYEIIGMLAPDVETTGVSSVRDGSALPQGFFEEYDLDPNAKVPTAISVAGRAPGKNDSAIVFGVISTATQKVPEGMRRVLVLSDPTRGMGALAAGECDRVVAAIDLAERMQVPLEWLPVSSGARIAMDSGTENLDSTARVVRRIVTFTQNNGVIHLIVTGINVGAQSYWDSLATMLGHTRGILVMTPRASMVLTGRAALAASGSVSAEDEVAIGGYERVMGPNGQAQYYAEDLGGAYRILYQHYEYTYVVPGEKGPRKSPTKDPVERDIGRSQYSGTEFGQVSDIFNPETNPGRKKPFSMRALMRAVADEDASMLERWPAQVGGETAIVWDTTLGGFPVCLIGIESQNVPRWGYRPPDGPADWNGGTLFPNSSKKLARALNACSGNRPAVILANLSGFDGSPESMRKLQLEYGAEIARAVVNFEGPLLFLVVSRYHGGAYVVFSRELNSNLRAFAVEGSFASVIGGGPAAAVVFPREVDARVSKDPRVQAARKQLSAARVGSKREAAESVFEEVRIEKQAEVAREFDAIHSVDRAKAVGSLEGIISAAEIRPFLIRSIASA
jgi:acetyl-CoA carboxylase carboxyltransferase component